MRIQFITPFVHGILDYTAALALIFAPILLSLDQHSIFMYWFSIAAGIGLIGYSLLTDYNLSITAVFSYNTHLVLDAGASAAFFLGAVLHQGDLFSTVYAIVMGSGVIAVISFSKLEPSCPPPPESGAGLQQ